MATTTTGHYPSRTARELCACGGRPADSDHHQEHAMPRKAQTFTATFLGATRKGGSVNGNPTWILHTDKGDYRTQSDASLGYSVSNYIGGPGAEIWIGRRVTFTATPAGRVWDMELAK